ncbi:MAG: translation elongation factor Ts [Patescibacteria group bacterium]|nr:translation elongation factor Ts [Patescibacteria group bacterium]
MSEVTTEKVKQLRESTGAGVIDAHQALVASDGDMDKAKELLKEKGLAAAEKRAERATVQGLVESYVHGEGKVGVLVEVNCETDFVARTDEFKELAHEVAMQVAAMEPSSVEELLAQPYIREANKTVQNLVTETIAKTGENIKVKRFVRYSLGE